jgi:hypothetical protein
VQPQAQPQQGAAPQSLDFQSMGIEDLTRIDVTQLNEQQLDAFLEAMQSAGTR